MGGVDAHRVYVWRELCADGDGESCVGGWGQVEDMSVVEAIVATPVQEETWGQTHVTTLVTKVEYRPSLEERDDVAVA